MRSWMPAVLCAVLGVARVGAAQDMVFSLSDSGQPPVTAEAPSETLSLALRAYAGSRYGQAAVLLQRVVQGDTGDAAAGVQKAQLFLGKALVHLELDTAAVGVFEEVTREGAVHPHFEQVLPWLAQLAARGVGREALAPLVGRFRAEHLERLGPEARERLLLLMGRSAYDRRELGRAVELLARVGPGSPRYLEARLLTGIAHVRARRARPAIAAFREIVRALDEDDAGDVDDPDRMRDLAWLSLGRIYYTAAHGDARPADRGRLLGNAVEAWSRVSPRSDYWLDALFESAWALFVSDEHARALGNIHALLSPFFAGAFYPEAHVIKAVTFYHSCQMDNAAAVIADFHRRYEPVRDELARLLADWEGRPAFELMTQARARRLAVSPQLSVLLARSLGQRELERAVARVARLETEGERLERADAELRQSALGDRVRQDVEVAKAFARQEAGDLARARLERQLDELQELANQIDTVEIEILNWKRQTLDRLPVAPRGGGGEVHVDAEHVIWPFDGEYWRDELGYYRQRVSDRCPAR